MSEIKWICVNYEFSSEPYYSGETLSWTRTNAIKKFVEGSGSPWRHWRDKVGWRCVKVEVTIKAI